MRWHDDPGILPFDVRPAVAAPAGWYRFTAPPGLRAMTIVARGAPAAWAAGRPVSIRKERDTADGAAVYEATLAEPLVHPGVVAIRIAHERGVYGGAALPEPIALACGPGEIELGDWSRIDGLAAYSGGAWYRTTIALSAEQAAGAALLDLGSIVSSAEVRVNGTLLGVRVAPPWTFDAAGAIRAGDNRIEVLVYNTLANQYLTIPTRYGGSLESGLLGPVRLELRR
jgi:hypothetical protein